MTCFDKCVIALMFLSALVGCHKQNARLGDPYETVAVDPRRDTDKARQLNAEAVEEITDGDLDDAEAKLKKALTADLFFGPAHNNLGTVYLRQQKYYLAAWEFQYAVKLMPTQAEPRNNLGLVFEAVGRPDEAEKHYDEALQLAPDAVEITANLARLRVRQGRRDERTRHLLQDVVLKDTRPTWVNWARERLVITGPTDRATTQPTE